MGILEIKKWKRVIIKSLLFLFSLSIMFLFSVNSSFYSYKSRFDREERLPRNERFQFRHHFIERKLDGDGWGQTSLVDVDRDGDLDFVLGRRSGVIVWYEYRGAESWRRHKISERSPSDVGGTMLDVNSDGWMDMVAGGAWYQNPGKKDVDFWSEHVFDPELRSVHDVITADIDGDGSPEVITMAGGMTGVTRSQTMDLRWYKIPPDPSRHWRKTRIGNSVHAGIAAADIDRDGDADIVRSDIWLENLDRGWAWAVHKIATLPWDIACKTQIADINGDGRLDVVLTEAEIKGARAAWFEAPLDPKEEKWKAHLLKQSDSEQRGPYHSMAVADFDNDEDSDIFVGEMEHLGVKPYRWFIWENTLQDDGIVFVEHVILDAGLGTHEAVVGDVDGDGDIDIVGKLWRPVKDNANGGSNHADFLENLLIRN